MNSIQIIGVVRERVDDKYRMLEYALPDFNDEQKNTQYINIVYWTRSSDNRLLGLPIGKHIAIRGHLDACEKFGTIIVVEQFELL